MSESSDFLCFLCQCFRELKGDNFSHFLPACFLLMIVSAIALHLLV
jgi:hypothetical protein